MKIAAVLTSFFALLSLAGVGSLIADPPAENPQPCVIYPCRVLSIRDGDTLKIECRVVLDVRLLDAWAAEITGDEKPRGLKAKANLQKLAEGKSGIVTIPLTSDNIGKATSMSRILGRISIDGKDLSAEQVKAGFATKTKDP